MTPLCGWMMIYYWDGHIFEELLALIGLVGTLGGLALFIGGIKEHSELREVYNKYVQEQKELKQKYGGYSE